MAAKMTEAEYRAAVAAKVAELKAERARKRASARAISRELAHRSAATRRLVDRLEREGVDVTLVILDALKKGGLPV